MIVVNIKRNEVYKAAGKTYEVPFPSPWSGDYSTDHGQFQPSDGMIHLSQQLPCVQTQCFY